HQQLCKKRHWHVDYLTSCSEASVTDILIFPDDKQGECYVNQSILKLRPASIIVTKFGSSDCTEGCPTHLIYFGNRSPLGEIKKLFQE
ncbi:MAG: DUF123 domain-containing protein, partial [candidate division KSB1 bacterium]|nr:DUF123 domain-containing protein [candidate division KSB1 bacterium]